MSASISIHESMISHPLFQRFRQELRDLLRKAEGKARVMTLRGASSGIYVKDKQVIADLKLLMSRYGTIFAMHEVAAYEAPTLDMEQLLLPIYNT